MLDFPNSPFNGQLFTGSAGNIWMWDGVKWESQAVANAQSRQILYLNNTAAPLAANTNLQALMTYTIPAGQLATVGDMIRFTAAGTLISSADARTMAIQLGSANAGFAASANAATQTDWAIVGELRKIASNQQFASAVVWASSPAQAPGNFAPAVSFCALTDTSGIVANVNCRNLTTATAGSIVVTYLLVEYFMA
jgi:hypothetical protein